LQELTPDCAATCLSSQVARYDLASDEARTETYDGCMEILKTHSAYGLGVRYADAILGKHASEAVWQRVGALAPGAVDGASAPRPAPSRRSKIAASPFQSTLTPINPCVEGDGRLFSRPRHAAVTSESYRAAYPGVGAAVTTPRWPGQPRQEAANRSGKV
jgi:hypothetical protein